MPPGNPQNPPDDAAMDELYRLSEYLAEHLPEADPDWWALAQAARELADRLEARARQTA